jgi:muconolactone delta-isomerase
MMETPKRAERRIRLRFLTISKTTDAAALCPPASMRKIMEATLAWIDAQKKAGIIKEVYAIPGGRSAVICEHASADEAAKAIASIPMGPFMSFEVYPLADFKQTMKAYLDLIKVAEQTLGK